VFIGSCCSYGVSSGSRGVEGVLVYVLYKYVFIVLLEYVYVIVDVAIHMYYSTTVGTVSAESR
jgi:hypothetical protein